MQSKIIIVPLDLIDSNPSRLHKKYPYIESKLDALRRSMKQDDVGCWEGIIARKVDGRYQLAFGHHRVRAAKDVGLKEIPLIVRDLTDKQMLQFLGRENLDDYAASFTVLLETWEAAERFCLASAEGREVQAIDLARLLGWIVPRAGSRSAEYKTTSIADACNAAHRLIAGGHMERQTVEGLSVKAAREIVERAWSRMEQLERVGRQQKHSHTQIERAKKHVGKAVVETARKVKAGTVAQRDIRGQVDLEAYRHAKDAKQVSPLFDAFGKALAESISKMLRDDTAATKLQAVVDSLGKIEQESDWAIVKRVLFELGDIQERAAGWHKKISRKPATVTNLKLLEGGK